VFAGLALGSSALSVGLVQGVRGVGTDLRQADVVDVWVPPDGSPARRCRTSAYFGLKTGTHTKLDVRLQPVGAEEPAASSPAWLSGLPPDLEGLERSYVASEGYTVRPGQGMMEAVPIRATLKRLQGCCVGPLGGTFSASIGFDSDRIAPGSWVRNDLGFDLHHCWLIHTTVSRMGGMSRGSQIHVYQVAGVLKTGQGRYPIDSIQSPRPFEWPRLVDRHREWARHFVFLEARPRSEMPTKFTVDRFQAALLLLTTLGEYQAEGTGRSRDVDFTNPFAQHLDLSRLFTEDVAVFIGFADGPGPVRLEVRPAGGSDEAWRVLPPQESRSMFRFIVPVRAEVSP